MDDHRIIELLWQRSQQAISALENAYGRLLHRICRNILGSNLDAQECVNDTYLALWNAIPPQQPDPLCPFVCRVGRNQALKRFRDDRAQKRCSQYDVSLEELAGAIPDRCMEETLSARALGRAIDAFLDTLDGDNRVLFLRRYWFGDSVGNIAVLLGITPNAASVRLNRIRNQLKAYLVEEGLYET